MRAPEKGKHKTSTHWRDGCNVAGACKATDESRPNNSARRRLDVDVGYYMRVATGQVSPFVAGVRAVAPKREIGHEPRLRQMTQSSGELG